MYTRNKLYFLSLILLTFSAILAASPSQGQSEGDGSENTSAQNVEVRKLDEKKWETITKDLDYSDKKLRNRKKKSERTTDEADDEAERGDPYGEDMKETESESDDDGSTSASFNFGPAGQFIAYGIAITIIAFVLIKLLSGNLFFKDQNEPLPSNTTDPLGEEIHESDLERFLREALNKKEYKLAIRIYYLMILKELSLKNWIQWKKEKTNKEYLYEMRDREDYRSFSEATRLFEKVWYGDTEVNESEYFSISPVFKSFVEGIKRREV